MLLLSLCCVILLQELQRCAVAVGVSGDERDPITGGHPSAAAAAESRQSFAVKDRSSAARRRPVWRQVSCHCSSRAVLDVAKFQITLAKKSFCNSLPSPGRIIGLIKNYACIEQKLVVIADFIFFLGYAKLFAKCQTPGWEGREGFRES